jgi:hypothetical protein
MNKDKDKNKNVTSHGFETSYSTINCFGGITGLFGRNWSSVLEICVCIAEASPLSRINLDTDPIIIQKDKLYCNYVITKT